MSILQDDFFPQNTEDIEEAIKELIGRCPIDMPDINIETAIKNATENYFYELNENRRFFNESYVRNRH